MSELVGVICKTCEAFIVVGPQQHGASVAYIAGLDPYPCECGSRHTYGTDELVDELRKPLPYRPIPADGV